MSWQHSLTWMAFWLEEPLSSLSLLMLSSLAQRAPKRLKQYCKLNISTESCSLQVTSSTLCSVRGQTMNALVFTPQLFQSRE